MSRNTLNNEKIKENRRIALLKIATRLFALHRYKSITVNNITEAANCSHGLFYFYYKNKEELFHDVMKLAFLNISKEINIDLDDSNPSYLLKSTLTQVINIIKGNDEYMVYALYLLLNIRLQKNELPEPKEKHCDKPPITYLLFKCIETGQEKGLFIKGDTLEFTVAIIALLKGLTYNRIYVGSERFKCPSIEIIMNIVERR